ncbi:MAG: uroporphyrinogen decarboxylase family protein [Candidatus Brocadiia bacterium]|jgi:uroporphyrinogen decarboxylase
MPASVPDGVSSLLPRERMSPSARKLRDTYARKPDAPFLQREFGFFCLERWKEQGMPQDVPMEKLFGYDPPGNHYLGGLGWCEAAFSPAFEERVLEDRGEHELAQDFAGRYVLFFKGRRNGFMPEYVAHPVKDLKTWEESCKWRLDASTPARWADLDARMAEARAAASKGLIISQQVIGGYMYLRSLIGPVDLLYMIHDAPELIHECMRTWLALADAVTARHQEHVTLDELFFGEDICYNHGPLISPARMREYLIPYYQQLFANIKSRQIDKARHLYFQIDTDGDARPVIPIYRELGMDVMSPFEVAAGCDVVEIGRQYPDLALLGGVDKRELARGKKAIDRLVERIFPAMRRRGGYLPTCDHGVPEEVRYEDYLHYRKRCMEFAT